MGEGGSAEERGKWVLCGYVGSRRSLTIFNFNSELMKKSSKYLFSFILHPDQIEQSRPRRECSCTSVSTRVCIIRTLISQSQQQPRQRCPVVSHGFSFVSDTSISSFEVISVLHAFSSSFNCFARPKSPPPGRFHRNVKHINCVHSNHVVPRPC
jgi:hypothetical protein